MKIGEEDPYDGLVDTDGDGIPDSPDSDGDGIPDSEDDEPDIPNDEEEEEEEEEESFPYTGEYEGGVSLEIWDTGRNYCHESGAGFEVSEDGDLWGEGWCYNDWEQEEIQLEYSGRVSDSGEISGAVSVTLWLPTGGHGNWEVDTVEFDMDGDISDDSLDIEFEGEVDVGPNWGFDVNGESWGEK